MRGIKLVELGKESMYPGRGLVWGYHVGWFFLTSLMDRINFYILMTIEGSRIPEIESARPFYLKKYPDQLFWNVCYTDFVLELCKFMIRCALNQK